MASGSKEELQWVGWKRFLAFEKGNPQGIDSELFKKRVVFCFEQCLMHLYHYPDIWYDYATWNVKVGNVDAAIRVFERGLKAIPHSDMLKYAYAEMVESLGMTRNSQMVIYDPVQKPETGIPTSTTPPGVQPNSTTNAFDQVLKATPLALLAFLANLPAVEGPTPDADLVLQNVLHNDIPIKQMGKSGTPLTILSTAPKQSRKRKEPPPLDAFRLRHIQKVQRARVPVACL